MESELAWAAGFFDGEGCTYAKKNGKYRYPYIGITQADIRPIERFHAVIGLEKGKRYIKHSTVSGRPYYDLMLYKDEHVFDALNRLWPYLSEPKKEQVIRVLEQCGKGGSCGV